jgi:histidinol-phosphatase
VKKADIEAALALAIRAAKTPSASLARAFRSGGIRARVKPDRSFVTKHDLAAETAIRGVLGASRRFGGFAIEGEEAGRDERASPYRWLIDPIDGTTSFLRGIPTFGTIVALEEAETRRAVLGVIHLPMQGETFAAGRGLGAWRDGERIRVSRCKTLVDALVSTPDAQWFSITRMESGYRRLRDRCPQLRGYADCWAHTLTMTGAVDALVEPYNNAWDVRATEVLIAEAGGLCLTRPVAGGKITAAIFGCKPVVEQIADVTGF